MPPEQALILLVGGGIAGLSLAEALLQAGFPASALCLVDARGPSASEVPEALLHPFSGRSVAPAQEALWAYQDALLWLARTGERGRPLELIRVPVDTEEAERLERSYRGRAAGRGQIALVERLDPAEARRRYSNLQLAQVAYRLLPACAVSMSVLVGRFHALLRSASVSYFEGRLEALERMGSSWIAHGSWGRLRAGRVVLAVGAELGTWFPALPVRRYQGDLLRLRLAPGPSFALHRRGYLIPESSQTAWLGGMYRALDGSPFETRPLEELRAYLAEVYPPLEQAEVQASWAGCRLVARDFRPVLGPVPGCEGLFVFGALGSRGLLWAPGLAQALAGFLRWGGVERLPRWALASRWPLEALAPDPERVRS
ncbi:MAG: FAD-binding oxidoreductase [Bacteroidota bacterium]|nr:FAD-binding oxidoreductase [Rhodothermia bacterium]MCS7154249.1 FAD-binding oxidoreductase [Bacteroidota bacterium]MDW8137005.1 FAD-binding oxidoreductase [Bacteroidota bacterium]